MKSWVGACIALGLAGFTGAWVCLRLLLLPVLLLGLVGCATSAPGIEAVTPAVWRGPQLSAWGGLRAAGASEVVKLNCEGEATDAGAEDVGLAVTRVCISPRTDGGPFEALRGPTLTELRALDRIARRLALRVGAPAYIHCTHGCDRTALLSAMVLRYRGWSEAEAFGYITSAAGGCWHGLTGLGRAWRLWNREVFGLLVLPGESAAKPLPGEWSDLDAADAAVRAVRP